MAYINARRGRGRGGGRSWTQGPSTSRVVDLPPPAVTQRHLRTFTLSAPQASLSAAPSLKIRDVQYVTSYNWIDRDSSTILVPGKPPKWLPPVTRQQLREDRGQYFRDINAAQYPAYPTEAAIRAIYELHPHFASSDVDIFGCGGTIGSLLSFARNEERTFYFGVECIGKTLFLIRRTSTPKELIPDVRGYGHTFAEAYTVWDPEVKGSLSHQRIIRYGFAGLNFVVRTESDGYLLDKMSEIEDQIDDSLVDQALLTCDKSNSLDPGASGLLEAAFSTLGQVNQDSNQSQGISIIKAGDRIQQQAIFDLKTRSIKRKDNISLAEFLPRLWVNQTPNFILAWHTLGVFNDIDIRDVRNDINQWEQDNQVVLARFHSILRELITLSAKYGQYEIRRTAKGSLEIWSEVKGRSALPKDLHMLW